MTIPVAIQVTNEKREHEAIPLLPTTMRYCTWLENISDDDANVLYV